MEKRGRGVRLFLRDVLLIFLAALLISFLIKTFLIRSFFIPSASMESTLIEDDRIIVNQLVPDVTPIVRGDIVVFRDPGGWLRGVPKEERPPIVEFFENALSIVGLTAPDSDEHLIKRVIGLPGDTISCCNDFGQMSVNGVPVDEPYVQLPEGVRRVSENDFEVTVPEDSIWVMGDNRYFSADSREHVGPDAATAFVPIEDVVGRAIIVTAPVSRWGWLDNHSEVFRGVEDRSASAPTREEVGDQ